MSKLLKCMSVADEKIAKRATFLGIVDFIILLIIVSLSGYNEITDFIWTLEVVLIAIAILIAIYIRIIMYKSGKKNLEEH